MTRLTIKLNAEVASRVRIRALEEGTSVGAKVREFLSRYARLATPDEIRSMPELPVYRGNGGLQPGIDPCSNKSLRRAVGYTR